MDSARHVIKRILNPHFLSIDSARHVIERILNPQFLSRLALL